MARRLASCFQGLSQVARRLVSRFHMAHRLVSQFLRLSTKQSFWPTKSHNNHTTGSCTSCNAYTELYIYSFIHLYVRVQMRLLYLIFLLWQAKLCLHYSSSSTHRARPAKLFAWQLLGYRKSCRLGCVSWVKYFTHLLSLEQSHVTRELRSFYRSINETNL